MPRKGKRDPFRRPIPFKNRGVCRVCHSYGEVIRCPNNGCQTRWCDNECGQWAWDTYHKLSCGTPAFALHRMVMMINDYEPALFAKIEGYVDVKALGIRSTCQFDRALSQLIKRLDASQVAVPRRLYDSVVEIRNRVVEQDHLVLQQSLGAPPKFHSISKPNCGKVSTEMKDWVVDLHALPDPEDPTKPFWGKNWDKSVLKSFKYHWGQSYAMTYNL